MNKLKEDTKLKNLTRKINLKKLKVGYREDGSYRTKNWIRGYKT